MLGGPSLRCTEAPTRGEIAAGVAQGISGRPGGPGSPVDPSNDLARWSVAVLRQNNPPDLHTGLPEQGEGSLRERVFRVVDDLFESGVDDHLGAHQARAEGRVDGSTTD